MLGNRMNKIFFLVSIETYNLYFFVFAAISDHHNHQLTGELQVLYSSFFLSVNILGWSPIPHIYSLT